MVVLVHLVDYDSRRGNETTDADGVVRQMYVKGAVECTGRRLVEPSNAAKKPRLCSLVKLGGCSRQSQSISLLRGDA